MSACIQCTDHCATGSDNLCDFCRNDNDPMLSNERHVVARLTRDGLGRVLNGKIGMTFIVDKFTDTTGGKKVAHVRDYRYPGDHYPFQIWSIGPEGYEIL